MDPGLRRFAALFFLLAVQASTAAAASERPPALLAVLTDAETGLSPHPVARWRTALRDIERDRLRVERCLAAVPCRDIMAKPLADLVGRFSALSGRALISAVNRHYNAFPYVADRPFGKPGDAWESPLVFLQRSGDCEDFAIAKYLTLRLLGIPEAAMAILVLRHPSRRADHAVLLVENEGRLLVLDNLRGLEPWESYGDYQALFALTAGSSWRFDAYRRHPPPIRPTASE